MPPTASLAAPDDEAGASREPSAGAASDVRVIEVRRAEVNTAYWQAGTARRTVPASRAEVAARRRSSNLRALRLTE